MVWIFRYLSAFAAAGAGLGLRILFSEITGPGLPTYITFYPMVMAAALLAGPGPGVAATALTALIRIYWFFPAADKFVTGSTVDHLGVILFVMMGLFMSAVAWFYRRRRSKAEAYDREMALRESEARFRSVLESSQDVIYRLNEQNHRLEYISPSCMAMTGYSADELMDASEETILAMIHPDDFPVFRKAIEEMSKTGTATADYRQRTKNGEYRWFSNRMSLTRDEAGQPLYRNGNLRDVTEFKKIINERKKAEEDLWQERNILQAVMNGAKNFHMAYLDRAFNFVHVNETYAKSCGYRPAEMTGKNHFILYPHAGNEAIFKSVRDTGVPVEYQDKPFEYPDQPGRGTTYWNWTLEPVRDSSGEVTGLVLSLFETTRRKRTEEALRRSEARWNAAIENFVQGAIIATEDEQVIYWNPAAQAMHGFTRPDEGIEPLDKMQVTFQLWTPDGSHMLELDEWPMRRIRRGESVRNLELIIRRSDQGWEKIFSYSGTIVETAGGEQLIFLSCYDLTGLRTAEKALRRSREELEYRVEERTAELRKRTEQLRAMALELTHAENRERKRLASMLHDHLQQILVGAKLGNEAVQRQIKDNKLKMSVRKVSELLNESIKVSRSLTAELSPPILHDGGLVPGLQWLSRWMEEKQGFIVNIIATAEIPPDQEGISVLLFQSVRELLFNVIKHANVREALVIISTSADMMYIVIEDKGTGFDAGRFENPGFETGYGLFSVRERIEFLGGKITVDSARGKGTRVTITTPLPDSSVKKKAASGKETAAAAADTPNEGLPEDGKKISVLVADDHAIVREGFVRLIENEADMAVVGEASNGEEALDLARKLHPEVIIMDISMPKMSGIEATAKISSEMPGIAIIGLSMYEKEDRAEAIIRAGAKAYLTKDGPSRDLIAAIRKLTL